MHVTVRTNSDLISLHSVSPFLAVSELKGLITSQHSPDTEVFADFWADRALVWNGEVLSDGRSLAECLIFDDAVLELVEAVRQKAKVTTNYGKVLLLENKGMDELKARAAALEGLETDWVILTERHRGEYNLTASHFPVRICVSEGEFSLVVPTHIKVKVIKLKLEKMQKGSQSLQRLVHNGVELHDERTMVENGLRPGAVVELLFPDGWCRVYIQKDLEPLRIGIGAKVTASIDSLKSLIQRECPVVSNTCTLVMGDKVLEGCDTLGKCGAADNSLIRVLSAHCTLLVIRTSRGLCCSLIVSRSEKVASVVARLKTEKSIPAKYLLLENQRLGTDLTLDQCGITPASEIIAVTKSEEIVNLVTMGTFRCSTVICRKDTVGTLRESVSERISKPASQIKLVLGYRKMKDCEMVSEFAEELLNAAVTILFPNDRWVKVTSTQGKFYIPLSELPTMDAAELKQTIARATATTVDSLRVYIDGELTSDAVLTSYLTDHSHPVVSALRPGEEVVYIEIPGLLPAPVAVGSMEVKEVMARIEQQWGVEASQQHLFSPERELRPGQCIPSSTNYLQLLLSRQKGRCSQFLVYMLGSRPFRLKLPLHSSASVLLSTLALKTSCSDLRLLQQVDLATDISELDTSPFLLVLRTEDIHIRLHTSGGVNDIIATRRGTVAEVKKRIAAIGRWPEHWDLYWKHGMLVDTLSLERFESREDFYVVFSSEVLLSLEGTGILTLVLANVNACVSFLRDKFHHLKSLKFYYHGERLANDKSLGYYGLGSISQILVAIKGEVAIRFVSLCEKRCFGVFPCDTSVAIIRDFAAKEIEAGCRRVLLLTEGNIMKADKPVKKYLPRGGIVRVAFEDSFIVKVVGKRTAPYYFAANERSCTVLRIKTTIAHTLSRSSDTIRLILAGKMLSDHEVLSGCTHNWKTKLHLMLPDEGLANVRFPGLYDFFIIINLSDTIEGLKQEIEKEWGLPGTEQHLFVDSTEVRDGQVIAELQTLQFVLRMHPLKPVSKRRSRQAATAITIASIVVLTGAKEMVLVRLSVASPVAALKALLGQSDSNWGRLLIDRKTMKDNCPLLCYGIEKWAVVRLLQTGEVLVAVTHEAKQDLHIINADTTARELKAVLLSKPELVNQYDLTLQQRTIEDTTVLCSLAEKVEAGFVLKRRDEVAANITRIDGSVSTYFMRGADSIRCLKEMIEKTIGIPSMNQTLSINCLVLQDDEKMQTLPERLQAHQLKLFVTGEAFISVLSRTSIYVVESAPLITVAGVKAAITAGVDGQQLTLWLEGNPMMDDAFVAPGAVLSLTFPSETLLCISFPDGAQKSFLVRRQDCISSLKARLKKTVGCSYSDICLQLNGKELVDTESIEYINPGSLISFSLRSQRCIRILTLQKAEIELRVHGTETVSELIKRLAAIGAYEEGQILAIGPCAVEGQVSRWKEILEVLPIDQFTTFSFIGRHYRFELTLRNSAKIADLTQILIQKVGAVFLQKKLIVPGQALSATSRLTALITNPTIWILTSTEVLVTLQQETGSPACFIADTSDTVQSLKANLHQLLGIALPFCLHSRHRILNNDATRLSAITCHSSELPLSLVEAQDLTVSVHCGDTGEIPIAISRSETVKTLTEAIHDIVNPSEPHFLRCDGQWQEDGNRSLDFITSQSVLSYLPGLLHLSLLCSISPHLMPAEGFARLQGVDIPAFAPIAELSVLTERLFPLKGTPYKLTYKGALMRPEKRILDYITDTFAIIEVSAVESLILWMRESSRLQMKTVKETDIVAAVFPSTAHSGVILLSNRKLDPRLTFYESRIQSHESLTLVADKRIKVKIASAITALLTLRVSVFDSVLTIKQLIQSITAIPASEQILTYCCKSISDSRPIGQYTKGLQKATLGLITKADNPVTVHRRGKWAFVVVPSDPFSTVAALKQRLGRKLKARGKDAVLAYGSRELLDTELLDEFRGKWVEFLTSDEVLVEVRFQGERRAIVARKSGTVGDLRKLAIQPLALVSDTALAKAGVQLDDSSSLADVAFGEELELVQLDQMTLFIGRSARHRVEVTVPLSATPDVLLQHLSRTRVPVAKSAIALEDLVLSAETGLAEQGVGTGAFLALVNEEAVMAVEALGRARSCRFSVRKTATVDSVSRLIGQMLQIDAKYITLTISNTTLEAGKSLYSYSGSPRITAHLSVNLVD